MIPGGELPGSWKRSRGPPGPPGVWPDNRDRYDSVCTAFSGA
jgi:hypothetical protein